MRFFLMVFLLLNATVTTQAAELARLDKPALASRQVVDLRSVQIYRDGLQRTLAYIQTRPDLFPAQRIDKRILPDAHRTEVVNIWKSLLDFQLALESLERFHNDFFLLRTEAQREPSLLLTYAAHLARYRFAMEFIERSENAAVTFADRAALLAEVRSTANNSPTLITDYLYDAAGQTTSVIDPRGIAATTEYDSRGRSIRSLQAANTVAAGGSPAALPAKTETIYDAASRVMEVRSPRYFDAGDTHGVNAAKTVMTYTGRGRPATRTEAPGTPQAATESYSYDIAGHQISKTDARGHVWQTLRPNCCGRVQLSVDPLGQGTITRTDWNGNVVHQATVADVLSHENTSDPLNAKTLQEVTTKYDLRNRPVARTVWLTPRGAVVFTDPPIAGDDGIAATEGIMTRYQYDDNLTDGVGLDQQFSQHVAGLNLGTGCNGSAALVTNPEGERTPWQRPPGRPKGAARPLGGQ